MRKYLHFFVQLAFVVMLLGVSVVSADGNGRAVYNDYCHICHGTGMPDIPQFGDAGHWQERATKGVEALYNAALYGINAMPPMGLCDECSEQQIKDAVDYMVGNSN